jgi:hypothetical protein
MDKSRGQLELLALEGQLQASLDPLLRALKQQKVKQVKKLQQLHTAAQLEAEHREALAARDVRQQQRMAQLEAQRHEQTKLKAQHANIVEVRHPTFKL